ncbi:MAG: efflux RND transporter periplasmic adaptor subunit [Burkholderiales bacterium]|nr:efflux RND transporter periplasmic adaptor subunit [Burkholderiales bacterium]
MRNRILFALAIIGFLGGIASAWFSGVEHRPKPPEFKPASNPYAKGIYANGIIESDQENGENVNLYPEVSGSVSRILVSEGQSVKEGDPLLEVDESGEKATVEQQKAQADAAKAQIGLARANLQTLSQQYAKLKKSRDLDPRSVSLDALDNAKNAFDAGKANLEVSEKQYLAAVKTYQASSVLLSRFVLRAPSSGRIFSVNTAVGSYVSPQGSYETYSGGYEPVLVMGNAGKTAAVRCYVDEILIQRLPSPERMSAKMYVRGTEITLPLHYVRAQPYVTPKIELSNQRTERVDVRVLPLLFRFDLPKGIRLYPGQLVDVYIGEKE